MTRLVRRQWFLIALAIVLVGGALAHETLRPLTERVPRDPLVAAILLLMSLPIDLRASLSDRAAKRAVAVAVAVNVGLAGPLAWLMGVLLSPGLAQGLVIAALAPCTMASAAVWTRRGGGNEAVALAVTVVTSLLSFVSLPAWAALLIGSVSDFDPLRLGARLLLIVVAPLALGQVLRRVASVRRWSDARRTTLSAVAQIGLLVMVAIGAVRCGAMLDAPDRIVGPTDWLSLLAVAAVLHVTLFAIAWRAAWAVGADRANALGAAVAGSQKTLAVGLTVALGFGPLAIIPMIVYHALQLVVDAALVERLGPIGADPEAGGG